MQVARSRFFDVIVSPRPPGRAERPAGAALASRPTRPSMDATLCRVVLLLVARGGRENGEKRHTLSLTVGNTFALHISVRRSRVRSRVTTARPQPRDDNVRHTMRPQAYMCGSPSLKKIGTRLSRAPPTSRSGRSLSSGLLYTF